MPCAGPVTCARAHESGVAVCGYADGRLSVLDPRLPEAATAVRLHQSAQAGRHRPWVGEPGGGRRAAVVRRQLAAEPSAGRLALLHGRGLSRAHLALTGARAFGQRRLGRSSLQKGRGRPVGTGVLTGWGADLGARRIQRPLLVQRWAAGPDPQVPRPVPLKTSPGTLKMVIGP